MSAVYSFVSAVLRGLATASYIFRPAKLKVDGDATVVISGGAVTVRYDATFDRGLKLWFAKEGRFELPLQEGLNLSTAVTFQNPQWNVEYKAVGPVSLSASLKQLIGTTESQWASGQKVHVEIVAPCDTLQFLEFPEGADGKTVAGEQVDTTTIIVQKRATCRGVIIRNYIWRRTLVSQYPVEITVIKNAQNLDHLELDFVWGGSCAIAAGAARVLPSGEVVAILPNINPLRSSSYDVCIPLSFEEPDDQYRIVLHFKKENAQT